MRTFKEIIAKVQLKNHGNLEVGGGQGGENDLKSYLFIIHIYLLR